jgi:hypothetical protein
MRFIITGEETGGAFFMAEISVPPGGGPPPKCSLPVPMNLV